MAKRFNITEAEAKLIDEASIVLDLGDDGEICIDPPLLWSRRVGGLPEGHTTEQFLRAVVGDDQVELWLATGRTLAELDHWTTQAIGMQPGESSASSAS